MKLAAKNEREKQKKTKRAELLRELDEQNKVSSEKQADVGNLVVAAMQKSAQMALDTAEKMGAAKPVAPLPVAEVQGVLYSPRKSAPGKFEKTEARITKTLLKTENINAESVSVPLRQFGPEKLISAIEEVTKSAVLDLRQLKCELDQNKKTEIAQLITEAVNKRRIENMQALNMEEFLGAMEENDDLKQKVERVGKQVQAIADKIMGPGENSNMFQQYFMLQTKLKALKKIIPDLKDHHSDSSISCLKTTKKEFEVLQQKRQDALDGIGAKLEQIKMDRVLVNEKQKEIVNTLTGKIPTAQREKNAGRDKIQKFFGGFITCYIIFYFLF